MAARRGRQPTSAAPAGAAAALEAGVWLVASLALRRPVTHAEDYPHICGTTVTGTRTGRTVHLTRRDCAASHTNEEHQQ